MRRVMQHVCVATALGGTVELRAWMVGNGLLNVQADTVFNYTSNLESRSDGAAASFLTLNPSLTYERDAAILKTTASAGVSFERRLSGRISNQDLFRGSVSTRSDQTLLPSTSLRASATYSEGYTDDLNVNARVLSRNTELGLGADWNLGARSRASLSAEYRNTDSARFNRQEALTISSVLSIMLPKDRSVFTQFSRQATTSTPQLSTAPKLDQELWSYDVGVAQAFASGAKASLSAGYMDLHRSARETRDASPGQSGPTVRASLDGPFLPPSRFPKMTSRISLSYGYGQQLGLYDRGSSQLTGEVAVGWNARPYTRLELSASRTRALTVEALTSDSTSVNASVSQSIAKRLTLSGFSGYQWMTIRGVARDTEAFIAGINAEQSLGSRGRWFARLGYAFRDATSTDKVSVFSQHTVRFSVIYRF